MGFPGAGASDTPNLNIDKGARIRARWLQTIESSLAGMQPKTGAMMVEITGVVRHLRGDHPTVPTSIRLYVDADESYDGRRVSPPGCTCGPHVEVHPDHVVDVLHDQQLA